MKIYISLPISGFSLDHCKERAIKAKEMVERRGHNAITPFEVCPEPNLTYAQYIGRDIEALLQCDGIFLLTGWSNSVGCQIEWRAAQAFNLKIYHHISEISNEASRERHPDSVCSLV